MFKPHINNSIRTVGSGRYVYKYYNLVANETMVTYFGIASIIPVTYSKLETKMYFLIIVRVSVGILLEVLEMEKLDVQID